MTVEQHTLEQTTVTQSERSGRRWSRLVFGLVLVFLLAFLGAIALRMRTLGGPVSAGPAPNFTLQRYDGDELTLSDLRGQVVVVNFWASWCTPCRYEQPILERAWRRYKDKGVVFIGVDYVDTEPAARAYLAEFDVTYPNGPDLGGKISRAYRIRGVPETFFVSRDGRVADVEIGPLSGEARLVSAIEALLREPASQ